MLNIKLLSKRSVRDTMDLGAVQKLTSVKNRFTPPRKSKKNNFPKNKKLNLLQFSKKIFRFSIAVFPIFQYLFIRRGSDHHCMQWLCTLSSAEYKLKIIVWKRDIIYIIKVLILGFRFCHPPPHPKFRKMYP
jgi:hypothetical protein